MITLLIFLVLAIIFAIAYILVDIAWPVLLVLITFISIDVMFFKAIFSKKNKKEGGD